MLNILIISFFYVCGEKFECCFGEAADIALAAEIAVVEHGSCAGRTADSDPYSAFGVTVVTSFGKAGG